MNHLPHLAARVIDAPLMVERARLETILSVVGPRIGRRDLQCTPWVRVSAGNQRPDNHSQRHRREKRYDGNEVRVRRRMERERFRLPEGAAFDELYAQRDAANIGEMINIALDRIEEANKAKLEGVFRNIDFNSESNLGRTRDRNRRLKNLLEEFSALDLSPSRVSEDIIGNAYIYLIERFASGHKRFWRGVPPKSKGDYAFITHMVETARPGSGRVAVVVPHGVLFRGGAEGRIRRQFIEENVLDAAVGLPANLFSSTGIPVAILVFDRSRERGGENEQQRNVLFIDASREFIHGKNQNTLSDAQIDKIMGVYQDRKPVDKYAHVAPFEEISENDFNLNIPRYVDTFEEEEEIDVAAVQQEIENLEKELGDVRKRMADHLKELMP